MNLIPSIIEKSHGTEKVYDIYSRLLFPWGREWITTPVFLPGESYGQEEPAG